MDAPAVQLPRMADDLHGRNASARDYGDRWIFNSGDDMKTSREDFEAWFAKRWPEFTHPANSAYEVWQAAIASVQREREELVKAVEAARAALKAYDEKNT